MKKKMKKWKRTNKNMEGKNKGRKGESNEKDKGKK